MNLKFATVGLFIRMLIIIDGFTSNVIIFDVFLKFSINEYEGHYLQGPVRKLTDDVLFQ